MMNSSRRSKVGPGTPAFTLIELLLVLAIICLLAGLVLPALSRAKGCASAIQCLNQMRQIGLGVDLYAEDNQGEFPRSQHSASAHHQFAWGRAIAPLLGSGNWTNLLSTLYHCPGDHRRCAWSYGQNVYFELSPNSDDYSGSPETWRRITSVTKPSATILQAENASEADHIMPHFWMTSKDAVDCASQRHGNRSNYSFVDGHVRSQRFNSTYAPDKKVDLWNPSLAQ